MKNVVRWKLPKNITGDCLWDFNEKRDDPKWVIVHGCDVSNDDCKCEGPPTGPPPVISANWVEIVRMPCLGEGKIDAHGFLIQEKTGKPHCVRIKTSTDWVHYFYKKNPTTQPVSPARDGFEGYMECLNKRGKVIAKGILADVSQYDQLKKLMQLVDFQLNVVSNLIKSQRDGFQPI